MKGIERLEIKINNQSFFFENTSDLQKRKEIVQEFLKTKIQTASKSMTVEEYYYKTWEKENTKIALDMIGYYLSKMPEQNGKEDKMVLSNSNEIEMKDGMRRTTKQAVNLTEEEKDKLNLSSEDIKKNPKKKYTVYVKTNFVHYDDMTVNEKYSTGLTEAEETD